MTLSDFKDLFNFDISEFFDEAYKSVIRKIELNPSIHPIKLGKYARIQEFDSMMTIISSNSQIALKLLINPLKINLKKETLGNVNIPGTESIIVGNPLATDY